MSKRRIIGCLVVRHGIVVQSIGFRRYLPVGRPEIAARFLDEWGVDEIILLDIDARREGRLVDTGMVMKVSQAIHAPLTIGGGIRSVDDVHDVIANGADKISVNGLLLENLGEVQRIAESYGVQCVVGSIDVRRDKRNGLSVWADGGRRETKLQPVDLARRVADAGAGEILVNAIDRDGAGVGFDHDLVDQISNTVDVPVIAIGGAGRSEHFHDVLKKTEVSAVAAANFLHFTEHSIAVIKSHLLGRNDDVRLESEANYLHLPLTEDGRLDRRNEAELVDEIFEHIPREVI